MGRRCRRARGEVTEDRCDLGLHVDVPGDHHRAAPAARDQSPGGVEQHLAVASVGAPGQQHHVGLGRARARARARPGAHDPQRRRPRRPCRRWRAPPGGPPRRSPASLPTTAIRSPPPALEQASTSASAARGSCLTRAARQASYPSSTSPLPSARGRVVGCDAEATRRPSARSTRDALVKVDPKSTQTTTPGWTSVTERSVEVGDQVVGGLDADAEAHEIGGDLGGRCRRRSRGSSGPGAR